MLFDELIKEIIKHPKQGYALYYYHGHLLLYYSPTQLKDSMCFGFCASLRGECSCCAENYRVCSSTHHNWLFAYGNDPSPVSPERSSCCTVNSVCSGSSEDSTYKSLKTNSHIQ